MQRFKKPEIPALAFILTIGIFLAGEATARAADLVCNDGAPMTISYTGAVQDITIPLTNPPSSIILKCAGGKGGNATVTRSTGGECRSDGGKGGLVQGTFAIGFGPNELRPGRTLRFIVGRDGASQTQSDILGAGDTNGGGAGGTGILYDHETNGWTPLLVAGGGGGAMQGMFSFICTLTFPGGDSQSGECGGNGTGNPPIFGSRDGGCNGNGGGTANATGGGGLFTAGDSGGGGAGSPNGGAGTIGASIDGGWGCGGGGGGIGGSGGGGGGYSGGGGGGIGGNGGGGGSIIASFATDQTFSLNTTTNRGFATYQCDLCPGFDDNQDADGDGVPDGCDVCPGFDDNVDADGDGVADGCDACPGVDNSIDCNANSVSDCDELQSDGLLGSYYQSSDFTGTPTVGIDSQINFDWGSGEPFTGFGADNFTVRWTGSIYTESTEGVYIFTARTDDGVRLWVDGQLLIDDWTIHSAQDTSATINLAADTEYAITMEYFEADGDASAELRWTPPGEADVIIPAGNLTPNGDCDGDSQPDDCESDTDADGVPDDCDVCAGFSDLSDADADGVPDGCDVCPVFNDTADADSDGVPDGCDLCAGFDDGGADCNGNGIPNVCDLDGPGRFEDFSDAGTAYFTNGTTVVDNESIRLTEAMTFETGTVVFDPVSDGLVASFDASFDFKIGGGNGADGMSFALLDAGVFDQTASFGEVGPGTGSLVVSLDTHRLNPAAGNHATLILDGIVLDDQLVNFTLDNNQWHHAEITFDGANLTLVLTPNGGPAETFFAGVAIPGFVPVDALYAFGARTGGQSNEHRVDNVLFKDTSSTNDCDGNLAPDQCDPDRDNDGVPDGCDLCQGFDDNVDSDGDGVPDGCDVCPGFDDNVDADGDGIANGCDACPGFDDSFDADADGVADGCDACPAFDDNLDADSDMVPDGCDVCPGFNDNIDSDADGVADGCDVCPGFEDTLDDDGDGVPNGCDICCPGFDGDVDWTFDSGSCQSTSGPSGNCGAGGHNFSDGRTYQSAGCVGSVTVTGWANTLSATTQLELGQITHYSGGLGVRNADAPAPAGRGGDANEGNSLGDVIDNDERFDMVLFDFGGQLVDLSRITIGSWEQDADISVLAYTGDLDPTDPDGTDYIGDRQAWWNSDTDNNEDLTSHGWTLIGNHDVDGNDPATQDINPANVASSYWLVSAYNPVFGSDCTPQNTSCESDDEDYFNILTVSGSVVVDADGDGVADGCDSCPGTAQGVSVDAFGCPSNDCNSNGVDDADDISFGTGMDCNSNAVPDECDVVSGTSSDADGSGVPDECEGFCAATDVNCDGATNALDLAAVQAPLNWAMTPGTAANPRTDVNGDNAVSALDLASIQAPLNWASSTGPCTCPLP